VKNKKTENEVHEKGIEKDSSKKTKQSECLKSQIGGHGESINENEEHNKKDKVRGKDKSTRTYGEGTRWNMENNGKSYSTRGKKNKKKRGRNEDKKNAKLKEKKEDKNQKL